LIRAAAIAAAARRQRLPDSDFGAGEDIRDLEGKAYRYPVSFQPRLGLEFMFGSYA
jgi:hypothetical protein